MKDDKDVHFNNNNNDDDVKDFISVHPLSGSEITVYLNYISCEAKNYNYIMLIEIDNNTNIILIFPS